MAKNGNRIKFYWFWTTPLSSPVSLVGRRPPPPPSIGQLAAAAVTCPGAADALPALSDDDAPGPEAGSFTEGCSAFAVRERSVGVAGLGPAGAGGSALRVGPLGGRWRNTSWWWWELAASGRARWPSSSSRTTSWTSTTPPSRWARGWCRSGVTAGICAASCEKRKFGEGSGNGSGAVCVWWLWVWGFLIVWGVGTEKFSELQPPKRSQAWEGAAACLNRL